MDPTLPRHPEFQRVSVPGMTACNPARRMPQRITRPRVSQAMNREWVTRPPQTDLQAPWIHPKGMTATPLGPSKSLHQP